MALSPQPDPHTASGLLRIMSAQHAVYFAEKRPGEFCPMCIFTLPSGEIGFAALPWSSEDEKTRYLDGLRAMFAREHATAYCVASETWSHSPECARTRTLGEAPCTCEPAENLISIAVDLAGNTVIEEREIVRDPDGTVVAAPPLPIPRGGNGKIGGRIASLLPPIDRTTAEEDPPNGDERH